MINRLSPKKVSETIISLDTFLLLQADHGAFNDINLSIEPVAKARPRFGRGGRCYNSQTELQDDLKWRFRSDWDRAPLRGPVECHMTFWIGLPATTPQKKIAGYVGSPCLKHIDCDNIFKFFSDAMNGIIINDDSQIWSMSAKKIWTTEPRTDITLRYIEQSVYQ